MTANDPGDVSMDDEKASPKSDRPSDHGASGRVLDVFWIFLRLGLTSFGGPVAHIGYFREEFVARRKWFSDAAYADLVALCQFMPGPASSQVGLAIGLSRAGPLGAAAAWTGFTMPSALALIVFAFGVDLVTGVAGSGWLAGLKAAAVAVVAQALWGMARSLCPDRERASIAVIGASIALLVPGVLGQLGAIVVGAGVGILLLGRIVARSDDSASDPLPVSVTRGQALISLAALALLLVLLPVLVSAGDSMALAYFDSFFRSGALVFGGGHVVLPLLQAEVVEPGWLTSESFVAGYGAAQAVPGPLFTFAAYLGAAMDQAPTGVLGGLLCLVAIFLPSVLLVFGVLPFWTRLRGSVRARTVLAGVNAAVVGLLVAALYDPVWVSGVTRAHDLVLVLVAFLLLSVWKLPPWLVVVLSAVAGGLVGAVA